MKRFLSLLFLLVTTAQAATYYVPAPYPSQGKPCIIRFGDAVMVNLSAITVYRFYEKNSDVFPSDWKGNTVLFVGGNSVQKVQGNALQIIEKRIEECNK